MRVLGIESSCDETGLAVFDTDRGLLSHALYSQVETHREFGGVVPELASRDHVRKWIPLLRQCVEAADTRLSALDGIAYTAGPGLLGALLVGAAAGRSLAWALDKPAVAVHHMEGHLLAPLLEPQAPEFPFVCLLVSGGHTQLVEVRALGRYRMLGQSLDDAAGEAFDKCAKMLGLGYPGGPALARLAAGSDAGDFRFPRPMTDRPGLDFSFSGLKTHAILAWRDSDQTDGTRAQVARAFEEAIVDTLAIKAARAMREVGSGRLVIAGGVGANRSLRQRLAALADEEGWRVYFPRLEFCTDNGAMIALAGAIRLSGGDSEPLAISARARWSLTELAAPPQVDG